MPLLTSGGLGLVILVLVLDLGLVSSGLGFGLKNLILFTLLMESEVLRWYRYISKSGWEISK